MQQTLNQIVNAIKDIAENHSQVKTFYFGPPTRVISKTDIQYPLVCFDIAEFPLDLEPKKERYPFKFYFLDQVLADRAQELDVLSDQLLISGDFISSMTDSEALMNVEPNINRTRLDDVTEDGLAGIEMDVTLSQAFIYDRCQIPSINTDRKFSKEFSDEFE